MITPKIKALFQFIDYLHSNIDNFNLNNDLIKELELLDEERQKVSSNKTYKEKLRYDEIQADIERKLKILQENTANKITAKAKELNVSDFQDNYPNYGFNGIETDIHQFKKNFSKEDLSEIFKHKQQYIEYRTKTHKTFLSLEWFINELDEITKSLFDFFKDSNENEFEAFETKPIKVNSIDEMAEIISGKHRLNIEIDKSLSISEKLEFWKSIIDKHLNEPLTIQFGEYEFTSEQENAKKKQLMKLFGTNYRLISPLLIPERIYNEHFENGLNDPEFTYWFLQHNAQTYFDVEIKMKRFFEKLKTPLSENFIKAELKILNDFEQKAESLLHESKFDIYNDYSSSEYAKEIEYLRIKAEYYKVHALPWVQAIGNTTIVLYAQHVYLKEFLENELNKPLPPQPTSENESRTKKVISKIITNIDKQGWQYAFVSELDYNSFTDLLTNFFEYNPYTLPETIITLKRTCKTKVAKALGEIHKELSNENKLSTDTKYFELIRVLSHFNKETEENLYKALTR